MAAFYRMENRGIEGSTVLRICVLVGIIIGVSACGGGDNVFGEPLERTDEVLVWEEGVFLNKALYKDYCANPRTGTDPFNDDQPYPDMPGSVADENFYLRSWTNETYLWYDEVIDQDPNLFETAEYFGLLKTNETTPTGNLKDNFHFTQPTEDYFTDTEIGVSFGYGMSFVILSESGSLPREFRISDVVPGSPADEAGILRGMRIIAIDGADMLNGADQASVDTLTDGLFPSEVDELHVFSMQAYGEEAVMDFNLVSGSVTAVPVKDVGVVSTATGDVGYIHFNSHAPLSESSLFTAFSSLAEAGVDDLVLDLRRNPGGRVAIASQVAYMIAGDQQTSDRIFFLQLYNDKTQSIVTPFYRESRGQADDLPSGIPLPQLNLSRVFVLSSGGTCSASEAVMNGLMGVGVDVVLIGDTTCGKPYGFLPEHNCGTTYFTVQFAGANDQDFGEYPDGFSPANTPNISGVSVPGCYVEDDYSRSFGDPEETLFAAALQYRLDQSCPSISTNKTSVQPQANKVSIDGPAIDIPIKPSPGLNNLILE